MSSSEVAGIAGETGGAVTDDENRRLSLELIRAVVRRGLMELGQLREETRGFVAWELSPDAALERVASDWPAAGPDPRRDDICWLNNTAEGDVIGRGCLAP